MGSSLTTTQWSWPNLQTFNSFFIISLIFSDLRLLENMAAVLNHVKNCFNAQHWKDCPYTKCVIELEGSFFLFAIAATQNGDALAFGLIYALLYTMYRKNGGDGHFNPAVTTAEVMSGRTTTWFGVLYIIFQCIGAKLGVCFASWLLGSSLPVISSDSVTATCVSEFFATGALIWIWLLVHSDFASDHWKQEFIGFGVGLAYYVSALLVPHGSANPAGYIARKMDGWSFNYVPTDMAYFVGPIFASFLVSLMFQWYHK